MEEFLKDDESRFRERKEGVKRVRMLCQASFNLSTDIFNFGNVMTGTQAVIRSNLCLTSFISFILCCLGYLGRYRSLESNLSTTGARIRGRPD